METTYYVMQNYKILRECHKFETAKLHLERILKYERNSNESEFYILKEITVNRNNIEFKIYESIQLDLIAAKTGTN